jgi:hypothetical protein
MNFEKTTQWKRSRRKVPSISVLQTREEVATMIENDHRAETLKYKDDAMDGL